MPRRLFKRYMPHPDSIKANKSLRFLGNLIHDPNLWHLNRHSVAGAVAVGLFCGLIPGPLQMLAAALCCLAFRVNLPLALVTTLYTNPLTLVPLYIAAFSIGEWILGNSSGHFTSAVVISYFFFVLVLTWAANILNKDKSQ